MQVYREKGNYQARMPIEPKQPKHHRWTVLSRLLGNVVQDKGMLDAANSNEACAKSTCCNPANRQPVREPPGSAECGTNHVGLVMTLKALTLGPFGSRLLCKVRPVPVSNPGPISLPQNVWQHVRVGPRRSMRVRVGPRDVGRGPRQCRASAPTGSICASVFESVQAVACAGAVSVNALASARDELQNITKI